MRRFLMLLILLAFLVTGLNAQDILYARKIIEKLASPSMHGRSFVYNGIEKAAKTITKEYTKNGISPIGSTYNQWFNVEINTFPGPVKLSVNDMTLKPGIDFLTDPSSPGLRGRYTLIEIGPEDVLSGIYVDKLQKAIPRQLLLLKLSATAQLDERQKKIVSDFRDHLKNDTPYGASGVVEVTDGKMTWNTSGKCMKKPWILLNNAVIIDSTSSIKVTIKNQFYADAKTRNIIGFCKGTVKPDSFIAFTAHYDHIGSLGKDACFPGANDNASGVAMLLSLMQYFSMHPPSYSILFIATSAEELGLKGSFYFTGYPMVELNKIRFLVNLDLAGTGEEGIMVINAPLYKTEFDKLTAINTEYRLLPEIKKRGPACNSDHCPFYRKSVPCFYIYTLGGNASYHDVNDKFESLSLAEFEDFAKLLIRFTESF